MKKMLVTCALPYANGPIHLGHMLEHIQADIWVRYKKMKGNKVYFICADDTHGTAVMLKAKQLGMSPEDMINIINYEHKEDFINFNINYDNYSSTHSEENRKLSILIYKILKKNGYIKSKIISQFYDPKKFIFLPDRFIKGTCPKCFSLDQYGDNCNNCGAIYNSIELINPISTISNEVPILKKSEHFFFNLPAFKKKLLIWINSGALQKQVINKIKEWFKKGLKEWDISRDELYFGFEIPDTLGKYFYVWLDAPIAYISTFKDLCKIRNNINFKKFWKVNSKYELYHFIGKDIIYFHSVFWPAILEGINFRKPTNIFVHGYITINGMKMSKSKGTFIKAKTFLNHLDPDCLRYYYATKLSSNIDDIDLNLKDFVQKVNTDIVNKLVNLASRNANFINKNYNNTLSNKLDNPDLYKTFIKYSFKIDKAFNNRENNLAIKNIIFLADLANQYIDNKSPWKIVKNYGYTDHVHDICSMGIQLFRILMIFLKPVIPSLAKRVEKFLNIKLLWDDISKPLLSHRINYFEKLFKRITLKQIKNIIKESKLN